MIGGIKSSWFFGLAPKIRDIFLVSWAVSGDVPCLVALEAFATLGVFTGLLVLCGTEVHGSTVGTISCTVGLGCHVTGLLPSTIVSVVCGLGVLVLASRVGLSSRGDEHSLSALFFLSAFVNPVVKFDGKFDVLEEILGSVELGYFVFYF